jgi:ribulose-phosphate 3-epimerase
VIEIAPSILSADFARLGEQVGEALAAGVRRIHIDVMDGHFVPNITMGAIVVEALHPLAVAHDALLECHLMITEPDRYISEFIRAGAGLLTVHVEACLHLHRTVDAIRALGARPGVAVNPATPITALEEVLPEVDLALVMSVNPGFGGQSFIPASVSKIARLRAMLAARGLENIELEVDGGVNTDTISAVARAGATVAVAGSAVFNTRASVAANIAALRGACGGAASGPH